VSGCQAFYALWTGYEEREVISQVSMRVCLCLAVRLATLSGLDMRRVYIPGKLKVGREGGPSI
jgi:hypothetical protein